VACDVAVRAIRLGFAVINAIRNSRQKKKELTNWRAKKGMPEEKKLKMFSHLQCIGTLFDPRWSKNF